MSMFNDTPAYKTWQALQCAKCGNWEGLVLTGSKGYNSGKDSMDNEVWCPVCDAKTRFTMSLHRLDSRIGVFVTSTYRDKQPQE